MCWANERYQEIEFLLVTEIFLDVRTNSLVSTENYCSPIQFSATQFTSEYFHFEEKSALNF